MLKIYTSKLFDLLDGVWFKKLYFNLFFNGRKMFLKKGNKNQYFDFTEFEKNINYNLLYLSYIDNDDEIDCMSFGFDNLDFPIKKNIYDQFLSENRTATALLRIPIYSAYNENHFVKLYSDKYFNYCAASFNDINARQEELLMGIIYSEDCPNELMQKVTYDIDFINTVMKYTDIFLLKTPRYAGYDYVIFYSEAASARVTEACGEIEKIPALQ